MLSQFAVDGKSNEITAVPKLLELLSLKGAIITADALNCQRAIAGQIVQQGGDYALAIKGNQQALHADVSLFFNDKDFNPTSVHTATDADHGRIETRVSAVSTDAAWLQERHRWPGLAAIGKVTRIRELPGKPQLKQPIISSARRLPHIAQGMDAQSIDGSARLNHNEHSLKDAIDGERKRPEE